MTIWAAAVATVALLAVVALAFVCLRPAEKAWAFPSMIEVSPLPRKAEVASAPPAQEWVIPERTSAERVLGVRGPTLASATRAMPRGVTGCVMMAGYDSPEVWNVTGCHRVDDGYRVLHKDNWYRMQTDLQGRDRVYAESTGAEVEWTERIHTAVVARVQDWRRRTEAAERRQKWAAGS